MKIKFDCPIDFIHHDKLDEITNSYGLQIEDVDPECLIVNPGTDKKLSLDYFSKFKNLKVVVTPSTGTNHIDKKYLLDRHIKILCLLDDKKSLSEIHASAEFTWIHVMNLVRKFSKAIKSADNWRMSANEDKLRSNELHSKSIGIIGLGRIGKKIANYAHAFGMKIYYYDPYVESFDAPDYCEKLEKIQQLDCCDVISINCALTSETTGLITYGTLDNIRKKCVIVNTSRGEVVDEDYIVHLIENKDMLYGADVLCGEQELERLKQSKIYTLSKTNDNIIITPHVAGATVESQLKALIASINLAKSALEDESNSGNKLL
jgi:D-3-phosphoglycerate dehydrogenase